MPAKKKSYNVTNQGSTYKSSKSFDPEDDPALTSCGMGSWRPVWLQIFANPLIFVINMSIVGTIQGMTGPLFFSSISTLEKRFAFDSKVLFEIKLLNFLTKIVS